MTDSGKCRICTARRKDAVRCRRDLRGMSLSGILREGQSIAGLLRRFGENFDSYSHSDGVVARRAAEDYLRRKAIEA